MIIKIFPDKEKVISIMHLIEQREKFVSSIDHEKFPTNSAENYYEIIKELTTCVLLLDGLKTTGENAHKDMLEYLTNYKEFSDEEIIFLNDLRIKRNNSSYEGKQIDASYLQNHTKRILHIIAKLKKNIKKRI